MDKQGVLSVPAKALRFTPAVPLVGKDAVIKDCEGEHKVWTREGDTFTAHPVSIGISNGIMTEITGGINENTQVVADAVISTGGEQAAVAEGQESGERSPFMPGPPGNNKKKNNK